MRTALEHEVERLVERVLVAENRLLPAVAAEGLCEADMPAAALHEAQEAATRCIGEDGLVLARTAGLGGLDALAFFEAASAAAGACAGAAKVALLAEVVLERSPEDPPGPPSREHLLAVASRCGWRLTRSLDVTEPMLRHRTALMATADRRWRSLRRSSPHAGSARAALMTRAAGLRDGRRRGEAFWFERAAPPPFALVAVDAARADAMRELFAAVFRHPMSEAHWRWKYERGGGHAVALEQAGALVAHYGGLTRELRVFGEPALGCQICDVMVTPEANRSLTRRGPMQQVAATFLEREIGWGLPHAHGFGFPSDLHHRLAEKLRLYVATDRMQQVAWPALRDAAPRWRLEPVRLDGAGLAAGPRRAVDALWLQMAAALRDVALGVRDSRWLQWRYLERPEVNYDIHLVRGRWLRRPLGVIVTRRHEDSLELMDLVGPPVRWPTLVAAARDLAAAAGRPRLRCWVTVSQRHRLAAADPAAQQVEALPIVVPANCATPGLDPKMLEHRWFLMSGDADFT